MFDAACPGTAIRQMSSGVLDIQGLLRHCARRERPCVQSTRDKFVLLQAFQPRGLGTKLPARQGQCISRACWYRVCCVAVRPASTAWLSSLPERVVGYSGRAAIVSSPCGPRMASIPTLATLLILHLEHPDPAGHLVLGRSRDTALFGGARAGSMWPELERAECDSRLRPVPSTPGLTPRWRLDASSPNLQQTRPLLP
ncbi:hypothetical protein V8C26DRAFT_390776 [Trichoderma gracile]